MRALLVCTVAFVSACTPAVAPSVVDVAPLDAADAATPGLVGAATAADAATPGLETARDAAADAPSGSSATRCPLKFGAGPVPSCAGPTPTCTYPEGTCYCGAPVNCGGAYRPPGPASWMCQPVPKSCPPDGTPCTAGQTCHDGVCSWQGQHACVNGRWATQMVHPPP